MSRITGIIAILLISLGTLSGALILFNLLKLHFNTIKQNIGTLNAIGLGTKRINSLYIKLVFVFATASMIVGFLLSLVAGYFLNLLVHRLYSLESTTNYFAPFSFINVNYAIIILISVIFISYFTVNKYLNKSPGDLIYNR